MKPFGICALCCFVCAQTASTADAPLRGFSQSGASAERDWEAKFRAIPDPARMRETMRRLSARPHHVGSAYDKDNAEWIVSRFKEYGLDAHIEEFEVLFPTPQDRLVEMTAPSRFTAKLQEPTVPEDPTSSQHDEQLPTYNAYSKDGDVTGPLVYVNFGAPADYEELERLGVSVKGAIVIARYGETWRGIKPKVAAEHGAIGCLIYSDPHDDGYAPGEVFPVGPMRPKDGVQRGSVMDMPVYPGDPLTPGIGATKNAKRLKLEEVTTITKIPVLPISYADAQPLLAAIGGRTVPAAWRGSLPITYRVGPGPARVHLRLKFNWDVKPIYDVIARIPGAVAPEEWIIRGNHHDAWVNGAEDPISGLDAVLEEARAFGALLKQGWKPKRTIILAAWDGEEEGLLGSTEWAEEHAAELEKAAAVYINSDTNSRGELGVEGSHSLERLVNDVAKDITDPESQTSVWSRMRAVRLVNAPPNMPAQERAELRTRPDLRIAALGSGSDYTAFLDHLGIASLNLGYGGEDRGGIYHSIYDDFYWYTHFSDADFVYGRALAQTAGTLVMRLADADVLPLDFRNFTDTIGRYVQEVEKLARDRREQILDRNRALEEGLYKAANDPRFPLAAPKRETVPPFLNFAPLENGLADLMRVTEQYEQALAKAAENGGSAMASANMRAVNQKLIAVERSLTLSDGLPNRPWFKNQIYAPGFYTGYGVKTLPGVREAIEQQQWKEAEDQIVRVGRVLENCGEAIQGAATALQR
ncbi:MAG TPA: M28 family metallopeptidase [Candidatus Limnocylindrales bacterium]|nr:M28 family metallopeptidase [Candidatus Limnocylindrales bacterium]